ncbi:hypothetical protein [Mycobacterium aquaticum]|uniref:hypothetical protein n=1 Tax=Mycobacterium aquaticum TaxID=1927124 RepID=UPI00114F60B6|nr:hypothetical protein [Mycobacterium aquaticum]
MQVTGSLTVTDEAGQVLRTWQLSYVKGPDITLDRSPITVRQGEAFEVGFQARSASGQPQHFILEAPGWGSAAVDIPPNTTVTGKLFLTVPTDVAVGTTAMPVTTVPFVLKGVIAGATADGTTIPATIDVTVTHAQASVIVVGSPVISAAPGTTVPVTVDLSLNQTTSNTTIVVEPYSSPFANIPGHTFELNNSDWVQNGIPFVRHTRNLDASGTLRGQINLLIPPDTAGCAQDTTVRVKWSAYDGEQQGEVDLAVTVPYPEITFDAPIVSGGLAALGGHIWVTLHGDGTVEWKGHAHDSGADGYDFTVNAVVPGPAGVAVALTHSGHVGGTVTTGARDHDWDEQYPNGFVRDSWPILVKAQLQTDLEYTSDIGEAFESLLDWALKSAFDGAFPGGGAIIFVGTELGSLFTTGSLVPGARIVGPVLWLAGPSNTLFAMTADAIAKVGSSEREVHQAEYDWANNEVFGGALPPRDTLRITDTVGAGDRAFTFPRYDGATVLNLRPDGFAAIYDGESGATPNAYLQHTFLHELVHACQIAHSHNLSYLTSALAASGSYAYGPPGPDYSSFNFEQQAQIVSDWWLGQNTATSNTSGNQSTVAKDKNSPYFRYVLDARLGRFGWENW